MKKNKSGFDLEEFLLDQMNFSKDTFGPPEHRGPAGCIKHIRKELVEAEQDPTELIDVVLLALDGLWRHGLTPKEISTSLKRKLEINKTERDWPDWRDMDPDQAIEHVKD